MAESSCMCSMQPFVRSINPFLPCLAAIACLLYGGCKKDPSVAVAGSNGVAICDELLTTIFDVPFLVELDGWAAQSVSVDSLDLDADGMFDLGFAVHNTGHVTPTSPHDFFLSLAGLGGTLIVFEGATCTDGNYLGQCGPDLDSLSIIHPDAEVRTSFTLRRYNLTQSDFCGCIRMEPGYVGLIKYESGAAYCGFVKLRVRETSTTSSDGFGIEVFGHSLSTCPDMPIAVAL